MKKKKFSKSKITTESISEVKTSLFNKRNIALFVVGGIVLIMILSVFSVGLGNDNGINSDSLEYNGYELINKEGIWLVKVNGVDYSFEYSPNELEDIKTVDLSNVLSLRKVYLVFNPEEFSENSLELARLRQVFYSKNIPSSLACIKEKGCGDLPIIDCSSSDSVYLRNGNKSEIYKEGGCFVLEAILGEEPIIINRFIYGLLDIM